MKIKYLYIKTGSVPKSTYHLDDKTFLVPTQKEIETKTETLLDPGLLLCSTGICISQQLLYDFGIFHNLVTSTTDDRKILIDFMELGKTFETEELTSIEEFIKKYETTSTLPSSNPDFDKFKPAGCSSLRINYAEGYRNLLKAKEDGLNIYELIRLFVFATGLNEWQKIYQNQNLKDSLYYTVFEALIGQPKQCNSEVCKCDECNRSNIPHSEESLSKYQNSALSELLDNYHTVPEEKNNYLDLLKKINRVRGKTYHHGSFYNPLSEWAKEISKKGYPLEPKAESWPLERIVNDFDTPNGREFGSWHFRDLLRFLLVQKLINDV